MLAPVVIAGPTGVGKSQLAVNLALRLLACEQPAEVINADSFSMYRGMDIGTAKVSPAEQRGVTHHLIDVLDVEQDASVAAYQSQGREVIAELQSRGIRPIIVGGSGLYIRALMDPLEFPGTDPQVRSALEAEDIQLGTSVLYARLHKLDPAAAAAINPGNSRRIIRALEVIAITGEPFSSSLPAHTSLQPALYLGLQQDWEKLDTRLNARVIRMWEQGLVAEVANLAGRLGVTARRAVGYQQVLDYLNAQLSAVQAQEATALATRRLARKQVRWFSKDPRYHWLDAGDGELIELAWQILAQAEPR